MLQPIYLPENIEVEETSDREAVFSIHPYHPGYGPTVANALRRVLLSSLPGAAITQMQIESAGHEFTTVEGVKEDVVSIVLNLKRVRLKLEGESTEPIEIRLQASGEKKVYAKDFQVPPEVKMVNPDQLIATLTDPRAKFDLRCRVEKGRGYVPSEEWEDENRPIGTMAIDAIFTPVERVSFKIENVRVGQETNYHKLVMTIVTDGSVTPKEALQQAGSILADHFKQLTGDFSEQLTADRPEAVVEETPVEEAPEPENTLNLLQLPSRVHNALERVGITTVEQVLELTNEQIQDIPGLGAKAIEDIAKAKTGYASKQAGGTESAPAAVGPEETPRA